MLKTEAKNTGIADAPKQECSDISCPFHGGLKVRGRQFTGSVMSAKMKKTAVIEFDRLAFISKYERYEKRRTRLKAHNPDCIGAKEGDVVKIMECRPLSKTKNFVIIQKLGVEKGFKDRMEAREAAKAIKEEEKEAE
ncbi:30S ribosomal protein S17 [Candidatus Woesearchaeota archaeon]|nr:30S ribosomal protein S17 [Candidatus Woesearchaeota archaeon]